MSDELQSTTRRQILKKAAFVTPVIMTFPVVPSFARAGSGVKDKEKDKKDKKNKKK